MRLNISLLLERIPKIFILNEIFPHPEAYLGRGQRSVVGLLYANHQRHLTVTYFC